MSPSKTPPEVNLGIPLGISPEEFLYFLAISPGIPALIRQGILFVIYSEMSLGTSPEVLFLKFPPEVPLGNGLVVLISVFFFR